MGMSYRDREKIEDWLEKLVQGYEDLKPDDQSDLVYRVYAALDGDVEGWALVELIDVETFERKWFWRRKS